MSFTRSLLVCLAASLLPQAAFALATEQFGNKPIVPSQWGLPGEVAGVANLPTRVYWYEVNGSPSFFYRGDMAALNAALREFAKLPGQKKEIRLVAGAGETKDLQQKQAIAFDWTVHIAGALEQAVSGPQPIVMTVHVTVPKPTEKPDDDTIQKLIGELDSPMFAARAAAEKKLHEMTYLVVPQIQAALKKTESAEVRLRLENLLTMLKGVHLPLAEFPAGVPLAGPKDYADQKRKELSDAKAETRGRAIIALSARRGHRADTVKELEKFLDRETDGHALLCAASAAARVGADAKPLLPALKKQIAAPDITIKKAFAAAVKLIDEAKPTPVSADDDKRFAALEAEIQQTVDELRERKK